MTLCTLNPVLTTYRDKTLGKWEKEAPQLLEIYGRKYWPDRADNVSRDDVGDMVDGDFAELVKLWRKDHPLERKQSGPTLAKVLARRDAD
jgi:hypothetical protein